MPTGEDMILFVDRAGIYHAMQPMRALRPEQVAQLTALTGIKGFGHDG